MTYPGEKEAEADPWLRCPGRRSLLAFVLTVVWAACLPVQSFAQSPLGGDMPEVEFGARFVLPPSTTLAEATNVLSRVAVIGSRMARHPVPPRTVQP